MIHISDDREEPDCDIYDDDGCGDDLSVMDYDMILCVVSYVISVLEGSVHFYWFISGFQL